MMRVLILTASSGSGHNVAAQSLATAFERAGASATVVDHFRELVHPAFERLSRGLYYWVLRRAPLAWGAAYALGDRMTSDSLLAFGATRLGAGRLFGLLQRLTPDVVVTVHATPAVAVASLAERGVRVPPHTTVVTDFVAHSQWIAPHVDRYCVAAEEVKHDFVARGIAPERIVVTGVPVRAEFETPVDPVAARRAFGLSARQPAGGGSSGSAGRCAAAGGRAPAVASSASPSSARRSCREPGARRARHRRRGLGRLRRGASPTHRGLRLARLARQAPHRVDIRRRPRRPLDAPHPRDLGRAGRARDVLSGRRTGPPPAPRRPAQRRPRARDRQAQRVAPRA